MKTAILLSLLLVMGGTAAAADTANGTWNVTTQGGGAQLEVRWHDAGGRHNNDDSQPIDPRALGIADALASPGAHAAFSLHREAGDFHFDGWLGKGEGAGSYTFAANDSFFDRLRARGYAVDMPGYQMAFANLDITMSYVNQMEALGFKADVNHLIAMKSLNVTPQYVHDLQRAGVADLTPSQVVSLRAMHVDPAFIGEIAAAGFPHLSANQYVTLRAMKIDGAYIRYLRDHGFKNLTVNQVVTMKAERI